MWRQDEKITDSIEPDFTLPDLSESTSFSVRNESDSDIEEFDVAMTGTLFFQLLMYSYFTAILP